MSAMSLHGPASLLAPAIAANIQTANVETIRQVRAAPAGLRVAVVGCGYWGAKHVRVLSATPGVRSVALVESNQAVSNRMQNAPHGISTVKYLLGTIPDAVTAKGAALAFGDMADLPCIRIGAKTREPRDTCIRPR